MPRKPAPSPVPKLFTRRVRIAGASYIVRVPGPDGRLVDVQRDAKMGDEITASAMSIMTLDSVGALAPPGASREDVEQEHQERIARYRAVRSSVSGVV